MNKPGKHKKSTPEGNNSLVEPIATALKDNALRSQITAELNKTANSAKSGSANGMTSSASVGSHTGHSTIQTSN